MAISLMQHDVVGDPDIRDEAEYQASTLRTVTPKNEIPGFSRGVDLLKIVREHGQVELDDLDAKITRTEKLLETLRHERRYVEQLLSVAVEYTPR